MDVIPKINNQGDVSVGDLPHQAYYQRLNSKTILFFGFTATLALMIVLMSVGPYGLKSIQDRLRKIVEVHIEKIDIAVHMRAAARERSLSLHKMILSDDPFERDDAWMRFNSFGATFAEERLELMSLDLTPVEEKILQRQTELTKLIIPLQMKIVELINQENKKEAERLLLEEAIPLQNEMLSILEDLYHYQEDAAEAAVAKSNLAYKQIQASMYILSAGILALVLFIDIVMYKKIRSAELRNENNARELAMSRDKAQAASLAKSQFLATMSHELRTPLNAVIGYSDLLLDDLANQESTIDKEHMDFVNKIRYSGTHLLHVIDEILNISKIETGNVQVHIQEVNTKEIIEVAFSAVQPMAQYNNNQISLDYTDNIGKFYTDGKRLQQILVNLLSNACKFTDNGKVTLSVKREVIDNEDCVIFKVTDTGIGIAKEHQDRIFEQFAQADSTFTRRYEGVGLGLSVCKKFCQLLHGRIVVKSEPGKRSEFVVLLPNLKSEYENNLQPESAANF